MNLERPLTQKEKALVLGVHPTTISAMTRHGLPRLASARETIEWRRRNPDFRKSAIYPSAAQSPFTMRG